ncbi:MAG: DNA mismatch repair protein MutS, partial [Bacteroidota bacterium]
LDVSTGEFMTAEGDEAYIEKLVESFSPAEVVFNKKEKKKFLTLFPELYHHTLGDWVFHDTYAYERLNQHFGTKNLKGFGIEELRDGITAAGAILCYLEETQHEEVAHISHIARLEEGQYMWMDKFTIRNLELVQAQQEGGMPLIDVLDHTVTPMGARLLRKWLLLPLTNVTMIEQRLQRVCLLVEGSTLRKELETHLGELGDLERLIAKVAAKRINPREMVMLKKALQHIAPIQEILRQSKAPALKTLADQMNACVPLLNRIETTLQPYPPVQTNQGNLIEPGVDAKLDDLRKVAFESQRYLDDLLVKARKQTGITSLKIGENRVFGYYLEVRHKYKDLVPADWIPKQTLANAERYINQELKTYEEKIVYARERIITLEQHLFQTLVEACGAFILPIQQNAKLLAELDCYHAFAYLATEYHYTAPTLSDDHVIDLRQARHPVIEQRLSLNAHYVPNDVYLDTDTQQIMLITGPNMGGKSALLRQVQLIVIMAQIGCFVPATSAVIGIIDKLFSRVGASDNLAQGESTFMVEMNETANIVNNLSERSLVALDELGRGTGTADGLSIAQATIEFLHNHPRYRAKTLFATHYHELNVLQEKLSRVKNFHLIVKEVNDDIVFLHKLKTGSTPNSFGIQVAKMAGIPRSVTTRAHTILSHLQGSEEEDKLTNKLKNIPEATYQLTLLEPTPRYKELLQKLKKIEIDSLSPVEALMKLNELKMIIQE